MKYTLLANKVAQEPAENGLRVKEITVGNEQNNRYITEYDYNDPNTGKTGIHLSIQRMEKYLYLIRMTSRTGSNVRICNNGICGFKGA